MHLFKRLYFFILDQVYPNVCLLCKQFIKDHNFEHTATQLESGNVKNIFNLKKKRSEGHFYFGKWVPGKKKKKPNGEGSK